MTKIPLLPPSSRRLRPKRVATVSPILRPIATDPVAEINGTLVSETSGFPTWFRSPTARAKIGGASFASRTRWAIRVTAIEHRGVFAPEMAIEPDLFFDALAPFCTPAKTSVEDMVLVTRSS